MSASIKWYYYENPLPEGLCPDDRFYSLSLPFNLTHSHSNFPGFLSIQFFNTKKRVRENVWYLRSPFCWLSYFFPTVRPTPERIPIYSRLQNDIYFEVREYSLFFHYFLQTLFNCKYYWYAWLSTDMLNFCRHHRVWATFKSVHILREKLNRKYDRIRLN